MFRCTLGALARKVGNKASAATAAAAATSHAALSASSPGVSIPPIPGVRSARAFRLQKMAAAVPLPGPNTSKKAIATKGPKHPKPTVTSLVSTTRKAPNKAAAPSKAPQAKGPKGPRSAAKDISKKAKAIKARK